MRTVSQYSECNVFAHSGEQTHKILHLCRNSNSVKSAFSLMVTTSVVHFVPYQDRMAMGEHFCVQVALPVSDCVTPDEVTAENQHDSLARVVTPLWQIPYEEQLQIKLKWSRNVVQNFIKKLLVQTSSKKVRRISYRLRGVKPSVSGMNRL